MMYYFSPSIFYEKQVNIQHLKLSFYAKQLSEVTIRRYKWIHITKYDAKINFHHELKPNN